MLLLATKDLQIKYILTSRCCVCDGEAAAPLTAVLEPLLFTKDVNSFVTPRGRSCVGGAMLTFVCAPVCGREEQAGVGFCVRGHRAKRKEIG